MLQLARALSETLEEEGLTMEVPSLDE